MPSRVGAHRETTGRGWARSLGGCREGSGGDGRSTCHPAVCMGIERTTLLAQLEEIARGKQEAEQQLAAALQEKESTKKAYEAECHEFTLMLKEVVEENSRIRADLKVQTEQVYQL